MREARITILSALTKRLEQVKREKDRTQQLEAIESKKEVPQNNAAAATAQRKLYNATEGRYAAFSHSRR